MDKKLAIEMTLTSRLNKKAVDFIYDVCVGKTERMATKEIFDKLEYLGQPLNQTTINRIIKRFEEIGCDVGFNPCRRGEYGDGVFNWKPKPFNLSGIKNLKGTW